MGTKSFTIFCLAMLLHAAWAAPDSLAAHAEKYPATDSLTVRFFAKIFLLPSEDAPLMGIAEDAARLCVFRRKGAWAQVGFRNGTGWMLDGAADAVRKAAAPGSIREARSQPPGSAGRIAQVCFLIFLATGFAMLLIALALRFRKETGRRRPEKIYRVPRGTPKHANAGASTRAATAAQTYAAAAAPGAMPVVEAAITAEGDQSCLLEGKVAGNGLPEILQFLESGRRTGMLSVEDGHPAGVINFTDGVITFAQTQFYQGADAVAEILSLPSGGFRFFGDKRIRQVNCRLSAFEVLLHSAHRQDETGKMAYLKGG